VLSLAERTIERLELTQPAVGLWTPIPEKLPDIPHFANLIEIQLGGDELVAISRRLRDYLPARIAEVTLAIELTDIPRSLGPDAIDGTDEVAIRDGVRRLLEFPEIFRESGDRR
jgi:hypothetical protein